MKEQPRQGTETAESTDVPLRSRQGTVTVEFEGKTYQASYTADAGWVSLSCAYGSTPRAQLRSMDAQGLARIMLGDILSEARAQGRL